METEHVTIDHRASIGMDLLRPAEREAVLQKLEALSALPPEQWPEQGARRLEGDKPLYVLLATPDLYVAFSATDPRQLVIEYLFRPGVLDYFTSSPARSAEAV